MSGGSKKKDKASAASGYPTASYPRSSYPTSQTQYGMQPPPQYAPQHQYVYVPQPQYAPQQMGAVGGPYPGPGQYSAPNPYPTGNVQALGAPPAYTPTWQPPPPAPGPSTVVVQGGFDAGARFNGGTASIPPPPPGVLPNAAQMAAAQGQNVVVTQKKGSVWTGGSDGGYTFW